MSEILPLDEKIPLGKLDKVLKNLRVAISWVLLPDLKNPPEADVYCFLLNKDGKAPVNEDFIFYNQLDGVDGATNLHSDDTTANGSGGRQSVTLSLDTIRYEVVSAAIGLAIYRGGERDQSWRFLESVALEIINADTNALLGSYTVDPKTHRDAVGIELLHITRETNGWALQVLEKEYPLFDEIARQRGIVVAGG